MILFSSIKNIKDQRDYIAHGKRFGQLHEFEMTLRENAMILDNIISEIEKTDIL